MTFLSTSSVLPAPSSPQWPGLSTHMSDAMSTGFPFKSSNNLCSNFQTFITAGITYALLMFDNSHRLIDKTFIDSINVIVLLDSIPVLRILAAMSRLKAGNLFIRGPVDHDILCFAVAEHEISILQ